MSTRIPNTLLARVDEAVSSGSTCVTNRHQVFRRALRKFEGLCDDEQAAILAVADRKNQECTTLNSTCVRLLCGCEGIYLHDSEFRAVLSWYMDDYEARPQLPMFKPPEGNYVIAKEG